MNYIQLIFPKDFKCPISKEKMIWGIHGKNNIFNSPSVDRIDPDKGYVKGNVRWVTFLCNTLKSNRNKEIIKKIYKDIVKLEREKKI